MNNENKFRKPEDVVAKTVASNELQPAAQKKIAVVAIQEIPFFEGSRIPQGMEFEILPSQFTEKFMAKK